MWLIQLIPSGMLSITIYSLIGVGIAGLIISFFLSFVPFVTKYRSLIQLGSIFLLITGIWMNGVLDAQDFWRGKVHKLESDLEESARQLKNAQGNTKIEYKFIDRVKVITETKVVVQEKLKIYTPEIDAECKLSPRAVEILNDSSSDLKFADRKAKVKK